MNISVTHFLVHEFIETQVYYHPCAKWFGLRVPNLCPFRSPPLALVNLTCGYLFCKCSFLLFLLLLLPSASLQLESRNVRGFRSFLLCRFGERFVLTI